MLGFGIGGVPQRDHLGPEAAQPDHILDFLGEEAETGKLAGL